ncbi:GTPase-activating protein and VPS9 domain-containing protein 1-like isoform X1 [Saccostrea cucullata]|uniref:GTPase-activating protein and VPS9 domain-containing protein 1-like isoform X1 n=1 Tax=Saccostrea cuccullata TaxID=36930 RepID=UPI002ED21E46
MELLELARQLKQEQLFVNAEKTQIHNLYEEAKRVAEDLYHESWIVRQQRVCLEQLQASATNMTPKECYSQTNNLEFTNFVDSYKHLSYHESKYGEFLKFLKDNHFLIATLIDSAEKVSQESLRKFISLSVTSIFGNVVFPEDEVSMIQTVKCLAELQLATNDSPRLLLRKKNCGFSVAVKLLFDSLYSAKLFLTAALHDPVMRLLMEDEWFYDIDPQKALHRFPPQERIKRFGEPSSADYDKKCNEYRKFIVDKLVVLSNRFIISIKNNMHCFPSNLAWLVSQIYLALMKTGRHDEERARAVCADLVFSLFICPAIVDPEPYGITSDIQISHIARHNLMQIAQIIQVLAVSQWEAESKEKDLYERFEKGCITSLLDVLLDGVRTDIVSPSAVNQMISVARSSVLITLQDLNFLITLIRSLSSNLGESAEKKQLEELLSRIPTLLNCLPPSSSQVNRTPPGTPKERKTRDKKRGLPEVFNVPSPQDESVKEILVVPLNMDSECPGMMSEQKVLSMEQDNKPRRVKYHDVPNYEVAEGGGMFTSKRTRFSLSQDQESIGNTSEIQEAFSEAASSHSVGSVEEDDDNDNMSDMISANVSGRGTPNISGRDTPLSQAGSVEEAPPPQMPLPEIPPLPHTVPKPNREDVTDRFGKFEIRADIERVETKSTVSDTWSTDVLASDSEPPPEANQYDRLEELIRSSFLPRQDHVSEVSETASDAWSTDVLASDTEDKQALSEFDQDDVGSVTDLASIMSGDAGNLENAEGRRSPSEDLPIGQGLEAAGGAEATPPPLPNKLKVNRKSGKPSPHNDVFMEDDPFHLSETNRLSLPPPKPAPRIHSARNKSSNLLAVPEHSSSQKQGTHSSIQTFKPLLQPEKFPPSSQQQDRLPLTLPAEQTQSDKAPKPMSSAPPLDLDKLPHPVPFPVQRDRLSHPLPSVPPTQPDRLSLPSQLDDNGRQQESLLTFEQSGFLPPEKTHEQFKAPVPTSHSSPKVNHQNQAAFVPVSAPSNTGFLAFENPVFNGPKPTERVSCPTISNTKKEYDERNQGNKKSRSAVVYGATYSSSDSGFGGTPQSLESQSLDSLIDTSCNVKFSEQQNTTFNTKRLSAALAMFDPVATETVGSSSNTLIDLEDNKEDSEQSAVKTWADSAASLQKTFQVDTLIDLKEEESKDTPPNRSRQNSLTSDSSGSDGVPFAKSSRSASFDNVSEKSEEKEVASSKDKSQRDGNKSFFRNLKVKLNKGSHHYMSSIIRTSTRLTHHHIGMKKKTLKSGGEDSAPDTPNTSVVDPVLVDTSVEGAEGGEPGARESTEDILEKYRPKPSTSATSSQEISGLPSIDVTAMKEKRMSVKDEDIQGPPLYDPDNLETCFAFTDTKRKLRLVLSNTDIQLGYNLLEFSPQVRQEGGKTDSSELFKMLRGQLAEAINLQDKDTIAQLHEAIRCVRLFDGEGCGKLVRSLQEDYQSRAAYISYLIRCRQGLLGTHSHLQRLLSRIKRDKEVCGNHITRICVKLFIERKESSVVRFMSDFQKLTVADEKTDHVEQFLQYLYQAMNQDQVWQAANESQMEDAQLAIERYIMSRIYTHAMFPNGDGDIMRDQLFHEHIKKLSQVITPSHKDLRIPRMYQFECPWTAAQKEIYMINAYKTPKDKVKCVFRCATTIMNLLSMANEKAVPAADDFIPVLIYVIIKANPPCMLSTIQYVQSFYGNRIGGEEQYWWIQFCSAAEFIKNMEYTNE